MNVAFKSKILDLIEKETGYKLNECDRTNVFLKTRLGPIISILQNDYPIQTYDDLIPLFKNDRSIQEAIVASVTTHTTEFFREKVHFEFIEKNIEKWLENKIEKADFEIRIWCAATSTGQEIYSLLFVLQKLKNQYPNLFSRFETKVLSTDIDTKSLQTAAKGVYSEDLVRGIPENDLRMNFEMRTALIQVGKSQVKKKYYRIKKEFRQSIHFAAHNLINTPYPFQKGFDIVFCRNVLIYFAPEKATNVTEEIAKHLKPGGLLFLGHSETSAAQSVTSITQLTAAVYQKKNESGK